MKIKVRIVFLLGVLVAVLPFAGISFEIKKYIFGILGVVICVMTVFIHRQLLAMSFKEKIK